MDQKSKLGRLQTELAKFYSRLSTWSWCQFSWVVPNFELQRQWSRNGFVI